MTSGTLSGFVLLFSISIGLAFVAYCLTRWLLKGEEDRKYAAAKAAGMMVLLLSTALLSILFKDSSTPQAVTDRLAAVFASVLNGLRWFHLLVPALLASVVITIRYHAFSWSYYRLQRSDSLRRLTATSLIAGAGRTLLFLFVRYSLNLLILYYLYLQTGSIGLTALAAAASVAHLFIIRYFYRRSFMLESRLGSGSRLRFSRMWQVYVPVTLVPALICLGVNGLANPVRLAPATPQGGPDSTWFYVYLVLGLLVGAATIFVIFILTSHMIGKRLHSRLVHSEYRSRLSVGLVRVSVLALFVLPAGLSLKGGWLTYAVCALLFYALLEWLVAAAHVRLGDDYRSLMRAEK